MIPYTMATSFNYNSSIVTYNNDNYSYMDDYLKHEDFNLKFIKKRFKNHRYDIILYLALNARKIDVLQVFHFDDVFNFTIYFLIYKLLNWNGKIYAKLDADYHLTTFLMEDKGFWPAVRNFTLKYLVDCLSIETLENYHRLENSKMRYAGKLIYLPNGIDIPPEDNMDNFPAKEDKNVKKDYILTVGRLGSKEKAIDVLMEAFSKIKDLKGWKLVLVGDFENQFEDYVRQYFERNPQLRDRVVFAGFIKDRNEIYQYYSQSKIFCFTSRKESFGIVLVEAAYFGNYLISTDVGGAKDVLKVTNYGELIEKDKVDLLAARLEDLIKNWQKYENNPQLKKNLIKEHFSWPYLCQKLYKMLNE